MRPLSLLLISAICFAEDTQLVTLKDGRVIEGIYDAKSGKLSLGGGSFITVTPEDVVKVEPATIDPNAKQKRLISKLKQERQGAMMNLKQAQAALGRHPEQQLADCDAGIQSLAEIEPEAIKRAQELKDSANAYARQIALAEAPIKTRTQGVATGESATVDGSGKPIAGSAAASAGEVESVSVKDLSAAHEELDRLHSEAASASDLARRIVDRKEQLENRKAELLAATAAAQRWSYRVAQIDKELSEIPQLP